MRLKLLLTISNLLAVYILLGNMASPIKEGTLGGQTFINRNIEVLSEEIKIRPGSTFESALIDVKYQIRSDSFGISIPLVFHAAGYGDGIKISFDGKEVEPYEYFPADYVHLEQSGLDTLSSGITIKWSQYHEFQADVNDLKYFEVDIQPGTHEVQVSYTAYAWIDRGDWVKKRIFYYSLSPISFWKSHGQIEVELDYAEITEIIDQVSVNLGEDYEEDEIKQKQRWILNELSDDFIKLEFVPEMSWLSKWLINISPLGITILLGPFFMILHLWLISYSKNRTGYVSNWIVFTGAIIVPLLIYLMFLFAFSLIDYTLAEHASQFHGYYFLTIIFVPFGIFFYAILAHSYKKTLSE